MNFPKQNFPLLVAIFLFFSSLAFTQDLRKQAEENPLSTVLYLLSTTDKDSKEEQKACLAKSFVRANRFNEIESVANMVKKESYVDENFVELFSDLISKEKNEEASKLVTFLIKKFEDDEYRLQMLLKPLIRLHRENEALQIINNFDSDKIDGAIELAKAYLELDRKDDALRIIEKFTILTEKSEYDEDKAELALFYAKLGKEPEALKFLQVSMKNLKWTTGKPEYLESRIIDKAIEIYQTLGMNKEANELLAKQGLTEKTETQIEIAQNYLKKGNLIGAKELFEKSLKQLNPNEYSDSFALGNIIEIYLKIGEIEKAELLTKNLIGNEYLQQGYLLKITDLYIKINNYSKASALLNFALEQTKKIDTSEAESGQLWTSGKWDQARYQSQIVLRWIDMKFDKQALELISQLKKPYLRALMLTEFVSVNKKRIPAKQLSKYLEEALSLLKLKKTEIFDSKKFDVLAITARNFAEIGMKEKSVDVFAETLVLLDKEMIESGTDSSLLFGMCNIGVEFDNAKVTPNEKLKFALRNIIKHWENEEY